MDLLYLRHFSMHSDQSAACVLNIILFIFGLHAYQHSFQMHSNEIEVVYRIKILLTLCKVHIHSLQCH